MELDGLPAQRNSAPLRYEKHYVETERSTEVRQPSRSSGSVTLARDHRLL